MSAWFSGYRAWDDDTLAALANAGLLRRAAKDVESGKVEWAEQYADGGVIAVDGQRVTLDVRGPQQARCDCPAPGLCKHILGATLWLRTHEIDAGGVDAAADAPASPAPAAPPLHALTEVLALDVAAVFKAVGIAAVRRAAATPLTALDCRDEGAVLVMEMPELGQSCRYIAGAGVAGMVSEVPMAERRAVHLMALAALWREHGKAFDWPAGAQPAPVADAGLGARERQFLQQVQSMLHELLTGGLAHVSELTAGRLLALNMSARGEGLPRLASLLRNLGGTVDLLARRDHRAEERDALTLMGRIHALCDALLHAARAAPDTTDGERIAALRGRLRGSFDESTSLELLPLGAHWWQTRGGARGLTLAFWDTGAQRLLQAMLARPDGSDTAFTRHTAWSTQALWPGAGTAQRVCEEGMLKLDAPRLTDDGRLALGGMTRAAALPAWRADDPRVATLGVDDWAQVAERLRAATGLAGDVFDAVLLRPAAVAPPVLDEVQQQFDWPVRDAEGRWLTLGIRCGPGHERRVDNLDRLIARGAPVHAVLVRVERQDVAVRLVPVAVLTTGGQQQLVAVSLDFANESKRVTSLTQRILRMFEARQQQQSPAVPAAAPSLASRLLAPVQDVSEAQAATGRMPFTAAQRQTLGEALPRIASIGLHTVASALDAHLQTPSPQRLLRLAALCQWVAELEALPLTEEPF